MAVPPGVPVAPSMPSGSTVAVPNRFQLPTLRVPNPFQSPTLPVPNRFQLPTLRVPNPFHSPTLPVPNRLQSPTQPVPNRLQSPTLPVPNRLQSPTLPVPNRFQSPTLPVPNPFQSPTLPVPNPFQSPTLPVPNRFQVAPSVFSPPGVINWAQGVSPVPPFQGGLTTETQVPSCRYELYQKLGEGSFGRVYQATDRNTGDVVAVKVLSYDPQNMETIKEMAVKEIRILKQMNHPNIINFKDAFEVIDNNTTNPIGVAIVTEFCSKGSLCKLLLPIIGRIPYSNRIDWYIQLISALDYMHGQQIIHRDIKPANILVDQNNNLKLADLGLARAFPSQQGGMQFDVTSDIYMKTLCGTEHFMAPEVYQGHYTHMSDIFSMGLVMLVICELPSNSTPVFKIGDSNKSVATYIIDSVFYPMDLQKLIDIVAVNSLNFEKNIFFKMLPPNYKDRVSANNILVLLRQEWMNQQMLNASTNVT